MVLSWDTPRLVKPGEFPYIVGIMWKQNEIAIHFTSCAGAILNEFWYLTSGFCTTFMPTMDCLVIKAGSYNIATSAEHDQIIKIANIIVFEKYSRLVRQFQNQTNLAYNDIGLIKGQSALTFNDFVKPIKLPESKTFYSNQKSEYNSIASGWGLFPHTMVSEQQTTMRSIRLPIVHNKVCQHALRNLFPGFTMSDHQMCTRPLDGSIGACIANHGGPLVQYDKDNKPIVIGVVSWSSLPCTTNNLPPVYVRVSHFVNWIKRKTKI
ncbi:PREDICTED: trypsin-1-like [Ceratosolen solmsi marchali]|uniref:Trypsin-1-like n=1 Tax=Ceratosolen solmsi marchali TaxID=326594 RepID=A0AAJ7DZR4_9HYME|nr:PREDICTED: trypsin-1-like [Ceratosolen solmsi marchali]